MAGYEVFQRDAMSFTPPSKGDQRRRLFRLSDALESTRANLWEMPPGSEGRRHLEPVQEELFIALEGPLALRLGDPGTIVETPQGSVIVVRPGTPVQILNPSSQTIRVLVVGAPPSTAPAQYLDRST